MVAADFEPAKAAARRLDGAFAGLGLAGRLRLLRDEVDGRIVFTTSFGLEDQVVAHVIAEQGLDIEWLTLDTGRLFPQTYGLWAETEARFDRRISAVYPDHAALEPFVSAQGIDAFYRSVDLRKACCGIRKVEPLGRALEGASVWVTGLRADQSAERQTTPFVEFDAARGLIKANPLLDWTREDCLALAQAENIPINPLHAQGFLSIGCAPCTRAVQPGENERAGRWWWEQQDAKECGLHVTPDGRLVRALDVAVAGGALI